jgi:hypothetical protein
MSFARHGCLMSGAAQVAELKRQPGRELQIHESTGVPAYGTYGVTP